MIDPLDVRVRELWKATAANAIERDNVLYAIEKADAVTIAFLDRFYPTDREAKELKHQIKNVS